MLKKQELPFSVLEKILQEYNLGKIKKIEPLATSGNITFIIETDIGKYLLRLSPFGPRWRSKEEIAAELELVDYLLRNHFPVPRPIAGKDSERIIAWKNHFGYLREFIDGEPKLNPTPKEIEKFGKLVGWYHCLVQDFRTKNKRQHFWDLAATKEFFNESQKIILKSNFKDKKKFIEKFAEEIDKLGFPEDLPSGMIHEDLGKRHVLWQKEKIVGLIDFDRCYYGKLVLDLGQACRGWCCVDNWTRWSQKNFQNLLSGYQKKRKLTDLEKKYLADAIKFGILERSLSFCLRFIEVTQEIEDQNYAYHSLFDLLDKVSLKQLHL